MPSSDATTGSIAAEFPGALVDWSGHRSGGVRKPFFASSGRPCKAVIETALLTRVRQWARDVATSSSAPRVLLLVGGPGNGKTEAVEDALRCFDDALGRGGKLADEFAQKFSVESGRSVPRRVSVTIGAHQGAPDLEAICVVQDASVNDSESPAESPPALLVRDLDTYARAESKQTYIACVNRGVLDDALTTATERGQTEPKRLLEAVIRSVGQSPSVPICWPLEGFPHVVVWPMDVETLVWASEDVATQASPAEQLINYATDASKWPPEGTCAAGERCPFCRSRANLEKPAHRTALLKILRWNELATGKRWSFRDLFSLTSYLLAGTSQQDSGEVIDPCLWAARLIQLSGNPPIGGRPEGHRLRAPFILVGAQYEHAMFCAWPRLNIRGIRTEIRELDLLGDAGLMGLHYFLSAAREASIPATLQPQLSAMSDALDPAMADPSAAIELATRELSLGKDIDARFSQSVSEGLHQCRRWLSVLEIDLLERLAKSDEALSSPAVRRRRPATARRLQNLVRDFSCRLVRRSLGVRYGLTRERDLLSDYEKVIAGDPVLLHKAAKQVEALVNSDDQFVVFLNSTFGEPLAPPGRRATLLTTKQKVRSIETTVTGRPAPTVRFLSIGSKEHTLALTYELFRSVRELEAGMLPASLPRPVVALLDATRARLGGLVVRSEEMLDGAEICIGTRDTLISREQGEFIISTKVSK